MNLNKSYEYFQPEKVQGTCHIIGCGSVGSTVAENLSRMGVTKFALYDFDTVEEKNIVNQMFTSADVGELKVNALKEMLIKINPEIEEQIEVYTEGYTDQPLDGYVFLAVDDIDLRRKICEDNRYNGSIRAVFDFRTRLEDAMHYAAEWNNVRDVMNFIKTMNFSHEEAAEATPVSACGIVLGVAPTVRAVCTAGVCNFINYIKKGELKKAVFVNPFSMRIDEL